MRTYEDVKATLTRYRQELEEEAKVKSHYVVHPPSTSWVRVIPYQ